MDELAYCYSKLIYAWHYLQQIESQIIRHIETVSIFVFIAVVKVLVHAIG